jgi:hypothetical protein
MSLSLNSEGEIGGGIADVLNPGQFLRTSYVSEEQGFRTAILESVFSESNRLEVFPSVPSVLFWAQSEEPALTLGNEDVRRKQSILVVQPLTLLPPAAGMTIAIPPPLLPYRSVSTAVGGYSNVYNNTRREWVPNEAALETLLQFQIPAVCLPFEAEAAEVTLLIRAASRIVTVLSGDSDNLQEISELTSPLGTHSITIPVDLIRESCRTGRLFLQINVSDLNASMKSDSMTGEQDDTWQIERVLLTLKGHRKPEDRSAGAQSAAAEAAR